MSALYNDTSDFCANWLEDLEHHGLIAPGRVDRRSIADLTPADVAGPGQRHFFAGIGGWSYALRCAGVPDHADIWTGSCPCQPLSDAGKGRGFLDPRHLWPAWFSLIDECRPPIIFGEQVASRLGLEWLDLVFADLERCGYAVGAADLCAAGVGAPHQRQRLYFVAYAPGDRRLEGIHAQLSQRGSGTTVDRRGADGGLADPDGTGLEVVGEQQARRQRAASQRGIPSDASAVADAGRKRKGDGRTTGRHEAGQRSKVPTDDSRRRSARSVADPTGAGRSQGRTANPGAQRSHRSRSVDSDLLGVPTGATRGFWGDAQWILCRDPAGGPPVARPVEPGTFPLAHGVPERVGLLSGYGNAIVPQVAVPFIIAALESMR